MAKQNISSVQTLSTVKQALRQRERCQDTSKVLQHCDMTFQTSDVLVSWQQMVSLSQRRESSETVKMLTQITMCGRWKVWLLTVFATTQLLGELGLSSFES